MLRVVQVSVAGLYFAPVLTDPPETAPPQTIISLPVQTAVCVVRGVGALVVLVAVHVSVVGLYLRPVLTNPTVVSDPPQTIISLPVQMLV